MTSFLNIFGGETLGTLILVLLGNGVIANVTFKGSTGRAGGWICIVFGWALGVFAGVMIANVFNTGGHINPAVTVANMVFGTTDVDAGFVYISSQVFGAILGQVIINIAYWQHIKENDATTVLGMHSTSPTHGNKYFNNVWTEVIGTMMLLAIVFFAVPSITDVTTNSTSGANLFGTAIVSLTVLAIGLSIGGPTGYAINPARDLAPRLVFWVMYKSMPVLKPVNASANWAYGWLPVVAPLVAAGIIGGCLYAK